MLMSIATVSISGSLDAKLRAIHDARFQGVEIFENDLLSFGGSAPEVGGVIRNLGLTCTCFQPFRDFEGMPEPQRRRVFERAERKFDLMQELGTSLLLVCSSVSPAASNDRGRIVDDFRELGERAGARGLATLSRDRVRPPRLRAQRAAGALALRAVRAGATVQRGAA